MFWNLLSCCFPESLKDAAGEQGIEAATEVPVTSIIHGQVQVEKAAGLSLAEAARQADEDALTSNFTPLIFKKRPPFWPQPAPKSALSATYFNPKLFTEYDAIAERLVGQWLRIAEARVRNGINVCHLVDYFEDAILQQLLC